MQVAVVDDHADIGLLVQLAAPEHWIVTIYTSGEQALADPHFRQMDVIVLDWAMRTGMSGKDVLEALGDDRPPVVVYTAGGFLDEVMAAGPEKCVRKGSSVGDALVPAVEEVFRGDG